VAARTLLRKPTRLPGPRVGRGSAVAGNSLPVGQPTGPHRPDKVEAGPGEGATREHGRAARRCSSDRLATPGSAARRIPREPWRAAAFGKGTACRPDDRPGNVLAGRRSKPMRASARAGHSCPCVEYGLRQGTKPWSRGASRPPGPQSRRMRCQKRQEGMGAERRTALTEGKALEGEPHERHRSSRPGSAKGANRQEGEKPWRRNMPGLESRVKRTFEPTSL
jgi:hypothetical protein